MTAHTFRRAGPPPTKAERDPQLAVLAWRGWRRAWPSLVALPARADARPERRRRVLRERRSAGCRTSSTS